MLVNANMVLKLRNMLECNALFFIYVESSQFPFNILMSPLFNFRENTSIFIKLKYMHMLSGFAQKFNNKDDLISYISFSDNMTLNLTKAKPNSRFHST